MATIVLTGGGTAGHVMPNLALAPALGARGYAVEYMGTRRGMEYSLVTAAGIPFHAIHSGKLRRYLDVKNITDIFLLAFGLLESYCVLARLRPAAVFSKGGFVSCPVVWAAWLLRIPVILHESDITPGLANRLCFPFAHTVCHSFPESQRYLPSRKALLTGLPIRESLREGCAEKGRRIAGLDAGKPVVMVLGGSLGAERVNKAVRAALPDLLQRFQVCHVCGKGHLEKDLLRPGYFQIEFARDELPHLLAAADVAVSRAGATTVFELLALRKPTLYIPLGLDASRGDQIANAESLRARGLCMVLPQERMTPAALVEEVIKTYEARGALAAAMASAPATDGTASVLAAIEAAIRRGV